METGNIIKENSNKSCSQNKKEIIEIILGIRKDDKIKSTLQLALESARYHCGIEGNGDIDNFSFLTRQQIIDKIVKNVDLDVPSDEADLFSALLSYFICLEQIGTIFFRKPKSRKRENGIVKAIKMFSNEQLTENELKALKNLRNSLGHAFGLVNVNVKKATHKYTLSFKEESNKILELPKKEWDGNYLDKTIETSTIIYVFPLIRFIERAIRNVVDEYHKGTLDSISLEEIKSRFTIRVN